MTSRTRSPESDESPVAATGAGRFDSDAALGPVGIGLMSTSLAFLMAGIAWPQAADALLRLLLGALPVIVVVARTYDVVLPARKAQRFYSPFAGSPESGAPRTPEALDRFARDLGNADASRSAQQAAIPGWARRIVVDEAARRFSDHHGLYLAEPAHHPAMRSLVSEPTWLLVQPSDRAPDGHTTSGGRVPLSDLGHILDDLERL